MLLLIICFDIYDNTAINIVIINILIRNGYVINGYGIIGYRPDEKYCMCKPDAHTNTRTHTQTYTRELS